jgi:adenine-specific DNA-methyltransferase
MVLMSHTSKDNGLKLFLPLQEVFTLCRERFGCHVPSELINDLIRIKLLPTYASTSTQLVLKEDFDSLLPVFSAALSGSNVKYLSKDLFGKRILASIVPCPGTSIELVKSTDIDPAFYPAVRNLISTANSLRKKSGEKVGMQYYSPTRLITSNQEICRFAQDQLSRTDFVIRSKASQFAASAYYMGSKKTLSGFLVEGISSVLPGDGVVIDLMCGSGAAASAFGRIWHTYASDAQRFCTRLAMVQGGGFSVEQAQKLLERLYPTAHKHAGQLRGLVDTFLDWEDKLFHSGCTNTELLKEYRDFMMQFPTYPTDSSRGCWNPYKEVDRRKKEPTYSPYCLFTAYFANIYFGLRQCVEIDSLRYAIDQLENAKERQWALGALIPTLSALGTTYGGHFAQPRIGKPSDLKLSMVSKVLESRAFSVIHEFSVRLLNLAEASETSSRRIEIIPGPWNNALSVLEKRLRNRHTVVYLDPPYKREEYSRYYHVLETAIDYSYPSCIGSGKIPDKRKGERFVSEFFTRSNTRLIQSLIRVISEVLRRNWICAWSYADTGDADIPEVISQVHKAVRCQVKSFATPYEHKSHRGKQHKKVTEYLILFSPK